MRKHGHCCRPVSVRLSVRLSVMYCIQTAEGIVKLLCWPRSPIILVFLNPGADTKLLLIIIIEFL